MHLNLFSALGCCPKQHLWISESLHLEHLFEFCPVTFYHFQLRISTLPTKKKRKKDSIPALSGLTSLPPPPSPPLPSPSFFSSLPLIFFPWLPSWRKVRKKKYELSPWFPLCLQTQLGFDPILMGATGNSINIPQPGIEERNCHLPKSFSVARTVWQGKCQAREGAEGRASRELLTGYRHSCCSEMLCHQNIPHMTTWMTHGLRRWCYFFSLFQQIDQKLWWVCVCVCVCWKGLVHTRLMLRVYHCFYAQQSPLARLKEPRAIESSWLYVREAP